jgi:hypothetical protein
MLKKYYPFLIIFSVVFLLYHPVLTTFFSHDDFFHFKVSATNGSFTEFINLLGFHPFAARKIAFYRPIFRDLLYNSFYGLFGLNHLPFRTLSFIIHFINIYLVSHLMQKFFKNKYLSFIAAFFYGVTASNVSTLYYLAGGIQVLGVTMFILLTLIFFNDYLETKKVSLLKKTFITFLLALASHEQAASLPILMSGLILVKCDLKKSITKIIKLWPFFAVLAIYLYLNITIIGYSSGEAQYQTQFNLKKNFNSLAWYSGWAFGLPEMLIDFVPPGLKLDPRLMRYWGNYFNIIFPTFAISAIITISGSLLLVIKKKKIMLDKRIWFLVSWYVLALSPVLFLPSHKSGHYLTPALPAFWGIIAYVITKSFSEMKKILPKYTKVIFGILLISLVTLSSTSAVLGKTTYWAAARGKLAEKLINDLTIKYPSLPKGSIVYFQNDPNYPFVSESWGGTSKQAYFALNGEDALQLYFNDPTLKVLYEDLEAIPSDIPSEKIFAITAYIN